MPTVKGRSETRAFFASTPEKLNRVLMGAARAGGEVIRDEARLRSESDEVANAITVKASGRDGRITVKVSVKSGWPYSLGVWMEYGTDPHFISVDESQRGGRSVGRINRQANAPDSSASLVIAGQFVGNTVLHPGARLYPFLRPALDAKGDEAVAAAQSYINARITPRGVADTAEGGDQ